MTPETLFSMIVLAASPIVVLMFLFPGLDWGIDISGFEKIDFLTHEQFLAFLAP
jgi:preprotein translocase subunit SecF